jgi:HK97 gp10 family phage protein
MTDSRLEAQLKALQNINTRPALIAGGMVLLAASKEITPVDTGFLRDTQSIIEDAGNDFVAWMALAPYAAAVEFGVEETSRRGALAGESITSRGQRAQPYIRPAMDNNQYAIREAVGEKLLEIIKGAI